MTLDSTQGYSGARATPLASPGGPPSSRLAPRAGDCCLCGAGYFLGETVIWRAGRGGAHLACGLFVAEWAPS
jgi:hypothetical protein